MSALQSATAINVTAAAMDPHTTHGTAFPPATASNPTTSSSSDTDDVWGDDLSDGEFHRTMADREYQRMEQAHKDTGYREGIIEGKDLTMQSGFDDGYATGSQLGLLAGRITGKLRASSLAAHLLSPSSNSNAHTDLVHRGNGLLADVRSAFGSLAAVFSPDVVQHLFQDFEVSPAVDTAPSEQTGSGRGRARDRVVESWKALQEQVDEYSQEVKRALVSSLSAA